VLANHGADPESFEARQLTAKVAAKADLILTMTRAHRDAVLEVSPHHLNRTFTLAEASRLISEFNAQDVNELPALRPYLKTRGLFDIPDPIGRDEAVFASVGTQIADLLRPILEICRRTESA
jgi:protein-tyrosine phosphatase